MNKSIRLCALLLGAGLLFSSPGANASDYGCRVLLCLANPKGPTAVSECEPPIRQLFRDLAKGKPFPRCDFSGPGGSSSKGTYAAQGYGWYDDCPKGTSPLATRELGFVKGREKDGPVMGIGDGSTWDTEVALGGGSNFNQSAQKVCVGPVVGKAQYIDMVGGNGNIDVPVYSNVVLIDRSSSPRYIDVFVDNNLYRRVRW